MTTVINYTTFIESDLGIKMQYVLNPKPLWRQLAEFLTQIISVLAEAIPVVGPFVSFAVYFAAYAAMESSWISGFENSAPPILPWSSLRRRHWANIRLREPKS